MLESLKWQSPESLNPCWAAGGREAESFWGAFWDLEGFGAGLPLGVVFGSVAPFGNRNKNNKFAERVFLAPRIVRTNLLCIVRKYSSLFNLAATTQNKQLCTLREHRLKSHQRPLVNKLPRNVKTPPMITHCNESSMIDRQSNKELEPICDKILCFLPATRGPGPTSPGPAECA